MVFPAGECLRMTCALCLQKNTLHMKSVFLLMNLVPPQCTFSGNPKQSGTVASNVDDDSDDEPTPVPAAATEELCQKSGWPQIERDMAPSATVPSAMKCVARHMKRLEVILQRFTAKPTESLSSLHSKPWAQLCQQ